MSETNYRQTVIKGLNQLGADAVSIENGLTHPGTPDVNWAHGWIELKVVPKWPARKNTIVRISTFTQQQRIWLRRRWSAGGSAYLLARIGREHLLFDGETAENYVGLVNRETLIKISTMHSVGLDYRVLLQHLLKRKYD